jgi:hypothetical protein
MPFTVGWFGTASSEGSVGDRVLFLDQDCGSPRKMTEDPVDPRPACIGERRTRPLPFCRGCQLAFSAIPERAASRAKRASSKCRVERSNLSTHVASAWAIRRRACLHLHDISWQLRNPWEFPNIRAFVSKSAISPGVRRWRTTKARSLTRQSPSPWASSGSLGGPAGTQSLSGGVTFLDAVVQQAHHDGGGIAAL